jgi:hypothetical protein
MGQDEDRSVIWRIVAPPPLPSVVRPRASHRPKHVAPDDPRSNVVEPTCHEVIVNTGFPAILTVNGVKGARSEGPFVQCKSTDPEWILKALIRASAVSIQGHPKTVNAQLRHLLPDRSLSFPPLHRPTLLCLSFDHRYPDLDIADSELRIKALAVAFEEIHSTSGPASGFVARFRKPLRPDRIYRMAKSRHVFSVRKYNVSLRRNMHAAELFRKRRRFGDLHAR